MRLDRLRPGGQQRGDLLQSADQGALGHVQAVGGQRGDDPVQRPAQDVLLIRQPGQEHRGEQALRDHLRRPGRAHRDPPGQLGRALAAPPVPAPPPQDPAQPHLPVKLLRILGTQEFEVRAAATAPPQPRLHVDDALLGFQVRIRAAAVTARALPLPPPARPGPPVPFVAVLAAAGLLPGVPLLAGIAEQQAAERRDRLGQMLHLRSEPRDPHVQRGLIGGQLRSQRLGPHRTGTPHSSVSIRTGRRAEGHAPQPTPSRAACHAPNPACHDISAEPPRADHPPAPCRGQLPAPQSHGFTDYLHTGCPRCTR